MAVLPPEPEPEPSDPEDPDPPQPARSPADITAVSARAANFFMFFFIKFLPFRAFALKIVSLIYVSADKLLVTVSSQTKLSAITGIAAHAYMPTFTGIRTSMIRF